MIGLTHKILKLKTEFTVRKSVLHKVRNYLIALPDQPDLGKALVLLGILDRHGALVRGVPHHVVGSRLLPTSLYSRARLSPAALWRTPRATFT